MDGREDMTVLNEPGGLAWQKKMRLRSNSNGSLPDQRPHNFSAVLPFIEKQRKAKPVFVKEMAFSAKHYLLNDSYLRNNVSNYFFFLLRNPEESIISLYKKLPMAMTTSIAAALNLHDFKNLYDYIFQKVPNQTYIINSEDLLSNPTKTIEIFCRQADIPFNLNSLHWNSQEPAYQITAGKNIWYKSDGCLFSEHWNDSALKSSGFDKNLTLTVKKDINEKVTFEEIAAKHRESYLKFYNEQIEYYQFLLNLNLARI